MLMLPPKPKKKSYKTTSSQNIQYLIVKKFNEYQPLNSQKILVASQANIYRPSSSKFENRSRNTSLNSKKGLNTSLKKPTKSQQTSLQKPNRQSRQQQSCTLRNLNNMPKLTSRYWGVYQAKSSKLIYINKPNKRIQVASLTKIINLYTIFQLLGEYNLDPKQIKVSVSEWASSMIGTTAELQKRDVVTLQDLFYGMMLPSGNDAACQIAMIGGAILKLAEMGKVKRIYDRLEVETFIQCRSNIIRYLAQMNKYSSAIGMSQTKWANVHGLSNKQNKTTIQDMFLLSKKLMQNPQLRKIINTKTYRCTVQSYFNAFTTISEQYKSTEPLRMITWQNTNKMLWKGWNGIKTGVTPNAGPCLAASYPYLEADRADTLNQKKFKQKQYLVIIAGCSTMNQRWVEVERIVQWAISNQVEM